MRGRVSSMTGNRIRGRRPSGTAVTASPHPTRSLSGQCDRTRKTVNQVKETRHSRCCELPLRDVRHAAKNSYEDISKKKWPSIVRETKCQFAVFHNRPYIVLRLNAPIKSAKVNTCGTTSYLLSLTPLPSVVQQQQLRGDRLMRDGLQKTDKCGLGAFARRVTHRKRVHTGALK